MNYLIKKEFDDLQLCYMDTCIKVKGRYAENLITILSITILVIGISTAIRNIKCPE